MEILLSLTSDALALNQWAVQTLTNGFLLKQYSHAVVNVRGLQAADGANIVWNEIVRYTRERCRPTGNEGADVQAFNNDLVAFVFAAVRLLLVDMLVVPGVCRCCGCTMQHACPGRCSWSDPLGTICSEERCVRNAGPAIVGGRLTFPHLEPSPPAAGRPDPAGGEVAP
jgi:hypothetical protein